MLTDDRPVIELGRGLREEDDLKMLKSIFGLSRAQSFISDNFFWFNLLFLAVV